MKTSKKQPDTKSKNSSIPAKSEKQEPVTYRKSGPIEEEIREKAEAIYNQRIDRGEFGTALSDWLEAEALLSDPEE